MTNSWWEIQILSDRTLDDLVYWRLQKFGCQGSASQIKDQETLVRAYLPMEKATLLDIAALALWLRQDAIALGYAAPIVKWNLIDEEDWSNAWKQHWEPKEIGDKFIIYPAWINPPENSDRHILRLDPGSAFGTGAHATTQLCLEALEMRMSSMLSMSSTQRSSKPKSDSSHEFVGDIIFADIGCGSGILSIGALLLGATKVYAVDTDIMAIKATHHNRKLNSIPEPKIWVEEGSMGHLLANIPAPVHGFACNILADVIIDMVPYMRQLVRPDGWGILSGILLEQVPGIIEALEAHNWIVATLWKQQEWSCLTIRNP